MSRFESGCRRLRRCTQTGEGICLESRQAWKPAWGFKFLHLRYAPVAHPEEASGLSPVKGGFKSLREYIPLYQNGIWIRLRTGGLRVQIPPRVFSVCGAMEDALCSGHSPRGCGFDSRHTDFMEDCRNGRRGRFKPGFLRVRIPCPSFTTSRKGGNNYAMH